MGWVSCATLRPRRVRSGHGLLVSGVGGRVPRGRQHVEAGHCTCCIFWPLLVLREQVCGVCGSFACAVV